MAIGLASKKCSSYACVVVLRHLQLNQSFWVELKKNLWYPLQARCGGRCNFHTWLLNARKVVYVSWIDFWNDLQCSVCHIFKGSPLSYAKMLLWPPSQHYPAMLQIKTPEIGVTSPINVFNQVKCLALDCFMGWAMFCKSSRWQWHTST